MKCKAVPTFIFFPILFLELGFMLFVMNALTLYSKWPVAEYRGLFPLNSYKKQLNYKP